MFNNSWKKLTGNRKGDIKLKAKVMNPSKQATRLSHNKKGSSYVHRPVVITKTQRLSTTKMGNVYKFNPANKSIIKKLIECGAGTFKITLTKEDIESLKKLNL